jgi:Leucine-rich repeat (LRR) protein
MGIFIIENDVIHLDLFGFDLYFHEYTSLEGFFTINTSNNNLALTNISGDLLSFAFPEGTPMIFSPAEEQESPINGTDLIRISPTHEVMLTPEPTLEIIPETTPPPTPAPTPPTRPAYVTMGGTPFNTSLTSITVGMAHTPRSFQSEDLAYLRYMMDLTHLSLGFSYPVNFIDVMDIISELPNLTSLGLWVNNVDDIMQLSRLTNLTSLRLVGDQISDITPISALINQTSLELAGEQIRDLTPISGLMNLTSLDLAGNQMTNLTPLSGLSNLTVLSMSVGLESQITDWSPLYGLTNLRLYFWG